MCEQWRYWYVNVLAMELPECKCVRIGGAGMYIFKHTNAQTHDVWIAFGLPKFHFRKMLTQCDIEMCVPTDVWDSLLTRYFYKCSAGLDVSENLTCWWTVCHMIRLQYSSITWWRHQMETFSALLAICAGNSPVTGEFPAQRPATSE